MSKFTGDIGREEEDGLGWEGLLPSKEERDEAKRRANLRKVIPYIPPCSRQPYKSCGVQCCLEHGGDIDGVSK